MFTKFEDRYFFLMNTNQEMFLKWNTVQGIIFKDALENENHITHLMAQDIRDKFGEECDLWVINKDEFEQKKKPRNT